MFYVDFCLCVKNIVSVCPSNRRVYLQTEQEVTFNDKWSAHDVNVSCIWCVRVCVQGSGHSGAVSPTPLASGLRASGNPDGGGNPPGGGPGGIQLQQQLQQQLHQQPRASRQHDRS